MYFSNAKFLQRALEKYTSRQNRTRGVFKDMMPRDLTYKNYNLSLTTFSGPQFNSFKCDISKMFKKLICKTNAPTTTTLATTTTTSEATTEELNILQTEPGKVKYVLILFWMPLFAMILFIVPPVLLRRTARLKPIFEKKSRKYSSIIGYYIQYN